MAHNGSETPVGTPDELRVLGKSLSAWGSCAHPSVAGGRGCPDYTRCIFAQPENGGFRDKGPHNIGILNVNNETGGAREDVTTCFTYMRFMHDHNLGSSAKKYAVIAQEGEIIHEDVTTPLDPNSNKTGVVKMKVITREIVVPAFPRPGMPGSKIEPQGVRAQATLQRHVERLKQSQHGVAILQGLAKTEAQIDPLEAFVAASPTQMVPDDNPVLPPAPVIPRKRGRPRKTG